MPMIVQNKGDKGNPYHDEEGKFTTADDVTDGEHTIRSSNPLRLEKIIDGQPPREKTELEKHYEEFKNRKNVKPVTEMSQEELLSEIKTCNDFLVQKGIDLGQFKDSFAGDLKLKCANFRKMKQMMEKYPIDLNGCKFVNSHAYKSDSCSQAYMEYSRISYATNIKFKPNTKMNFNAKYFSDYESVLREEKNQASIKWHPECTDEGFLSQTFTHEYGHAIIFNAFEKYLNDDIKRKIYEKSVSQLKPLPNNMGYYYRGERWVGYNAKEQVLKKLNQANLTRELTNFSKKIKKEVEQIFYGANSDIANKEEVLNSEKSRYGSTNAHEWLAETFASLEGGKPTRTALALGEWLKKNGYMKGE
jgi:hypothetical protein